MPQLVVNMKVNTHSNGCCKMKINSFKMWNTPYSKPLYARLRDRFTQK